MATTMSDLPDELVEEILSRVPLTSLTLCAVRYTCKPWNALSRKKSFGKTDHPLKQFMVMDSKLCLMDLGLERFQDVSEQVNTCNNQAKNLKVLEWNWDLVDPCIKQASILNRAEMCEVFHWDGLLLLLCVIKDKRWRVVWNPYLGQIRWIKPHKFNPFDMYALGYDNKNKNRNHKILRLLDAFKCPILLPFYEIYDFFSDSWKVLHVNPGCRIKSGGVSLKGNTYFLAQENFVAAQFFLLCFDFTAERFGTRLALPFGSSCLETVILSCVRDEKLAVLRLGNDHTMEIWIKTEIELNVASSWSRFLSVEWRPSSSFVAESFFIDEEKKLALVSEFHTSYRSLYQRAYIIGVDGYFKSVNIGKARKFGFHYYNQLVFSSYAPSLVKLQINRRGKRKRL